MISIVTVRASDIPSLTPVIEPLISPAVALTAGRMTTLDAIQSAADGRSQLWLAADGDELLGAVLARPVEYPRCKALYVMLIAGKQRDRWEDMMSNTLDTAARHIGCDLIEGIGRRGWARTLPGYRVTGFSYEKELR